ncbi:hypothetical protein CFIMG_008521RA00001 [Ceratocystis fimbriata CBS 114723]|uniref:A-kinase anchor protein 7-like phosphoesterase domain-containing protein n=1 Tax=Ceratocystis fimbriata CBS 114723 TaxID=1035309 RepID=A0A2C5XJH6_9PEZI|nr:hypothetical protein CFIMG_008521RA00001 [Ceratocystis fimbriata CBS 114723]
MAHRAAPPRLRPTHFLCIPLVTPTSRPQLQRSLDTFRQHVTATPALGVPLDAIRPLGTLHLTLGVMDLKTDANTLGRACEVLSGLRPRALLAAAHAELHGSSTPVAEGDGSPPPLVVSLTDLKPMHTVTSTSVLYAQPTDPHGVLQLFCLKIRQAFVDAGLMVLGSQPELRLHATVVNTVYMPGQSRGHGSQRNRSKRISLDARQAVESFGGFRWASHVPVEAIAICRMGARAVDGVDGEAYTVEKEIPC